jgi:hypothetical protein
MEMGLTELFSYVISNPHELTDNYYSDLRDAIYERAKQLGVCTNE